MNLINISIACIMISVGTLIFAKCDHESKIHAIEKRLEILEKKAKPA